MRPPARLPAMPPARVVEIGGRPVECVTAGDGRPPIVLVNGASGPLAGWARVFGGLAELGTVVAYNRPGIGRTAKPDRPQTSAVVVEDLRFLLDQLGLTPPWVLVGHSLGGLHVQLLARLHPDDVAAIVLLESAHPDDRRLTELHPGWLRVVNRALERPRRDSFAETRHVDASCAELEAAPPFPHLPLVVVSGGRRPAGPLMPDAAWDARQSGQRSLAAMAPTAEHVIAERSGHFPQLTEPELVVGAVRRAIERLA